MKQYGKKLPQQVTVINLFIGVDRSLVSGENSIEWQLYDDFQIRSQIWDQNKSHTFKISGEVVGKPPIKSPYKLQNRYIHLISLQRFSVYNMFFIRVLLDFFGFSQFPVIGQQLFQVFSLIPCVIWQPGNYIGKPFSGINLGCFA